MIYKCGGFIIQRHNELRDIEAFWGRHAQHVHLELTEESLPSGANRAPDARLGIHARGFWEQQRPAFFDARVWISSGYTSSTRKTGRDCIHRIDGPGTRNIYLANQTSWQKVKNMNHFVFLSFYFAAKNGSPAPPPSLGYVLQSSQFAIPRSALLCLSGSRTVKRTIRSNV